AKIYSDFGHHPTEIKVTMEAARQKFPNNRIILIYEPHMFTRTKAFFKNFVKVFREIPVDKIIITDIYKSRETDKGLVTSKQLADAAGKQYIAKNQLNDYLEKELKENDVVFFMGAGDIDKIVKELLF
ncbi:UDP-N-acetylmuramate--L-alanine ligase, partial [Candidatus Daviesbacteria bacterium]|nr:UDP-N-acetylmuramate--L-alanine ligase [Candidatus Daviesbacteria bacterium]